MGKTCLNRLIGRCKSINGDKGCKRDYDTTHHPNNYDCRDYQEANIIIFEVRNENPERYSLRRELLKRNSPLDELFKKIM